MTVHSLSNRICSSILGPCLPSAHQLTRSFRIHLLHYLLHVVSVCLDSSQVLFSTPLQVCASFFNALFSFNLGTWFSWVDGIDVVASSNSIVQPAESINIALWPHNLGQQHKSTLRTNVNASMYLQHAPTRVPLERVSSACLLVQGPALLVALAKKLSRLDAGRTFFIAGECAWIVVAERHS
jgi:hypothetical protein